MRSTISTCEQMSKGKYVQYVTHPTAEKGEAARPDWAHVFLSVLPTLPLNALGDEARIAAALRSAGATVMARYGATLRRAAVAEWEVRLRVPDGSGAWRLVVSSPTGRNSSGCCVLCCRSWHREQLFASLLLAIRQLYGVMLHAVTDSQQIWWLVPAHAL